MGPVAVDDSGVYITEMDGSTIQRYSSDLTLLAVYSPDSLYNESVLYPNGISLFADFIYVVQSNCLLAFLPELPQYERRRPQENPLYKRIQAYWRTFQAMAGYYDDKGLPILPSHRQFS